MSLKETSADMEKLSNCPIPQHLPLQPQDIAKVKAIFIATKHEKTNAVVI